MEKKDLQTKMFEIISEIIGYDVDVCNDLVEDLGFDSIQIIMLFVGIEEEYDVEIDFEGLNFDKYTQIQYLQEYFFQYIVNKKVINVRGIK